MSDNPQSDPQPIQDEKLIKPTSDNQDFWTLEDDDIDETLVMNDLEDLGISDNKTVTSEDSTPADELIHSLDEHERKITSEVITASAKNNEIKNSTATDSVPARRSKAKSPLSKLEKISTLACILGILGVFIYLIIYASDQHNFDTSMPYEANTPAMGEFAEIESIETWWAEPIDSNTKFRAALVPCATITLGENATSGAILSVFYSNEEGLLEKLRPKGDPFTHEFVSGKFLETGTNQITIYGTDGLPKLAHFHYYRMQDQERWIIEVKEAQSLQRGIDNFKPLAKASIDPLRK